MSLKQIFKLVMGWRLILILIAIPCMFFIIPRPGFTELTEKPSFQNLFSMWANFDGRHYLDLAEFGYGFQRKSDMDYAFFPVYPVAVRTFNLFDSYLASGIILSHLLFILALYFLYKLIRLDYKPKTAKSALYLILIFPMAFFFGSVYTESLFLLLIVLSFFFARKNNFFLAGIFAALASATRITGIFIWPALIYEYWLVCGKDLKKTLHPRAMSLLLPPLGLLSFINFQAVKTGDPFFFVYIQSVFAGRETDKLVLIYQIFYRYIKMVVFVNHADPLFYTVLMELLSASLILLVLIFSFKKIRFSYWLFVLFSFILPTFAGTFMSMPRFTIVLFPVFIYLATWIDRQHPYIRIAYYSICAVLTVFAVAFFTRGYFVS